MSPAQILALLGVNAVLLPIRRNSKCPSRKAWQKITFTETQIHAYQAALTRAPAIGVTLGEPSEGLCTIDCDEDEFLAEMLALNPGLHGTLRTSAKRGGNIWFVLPHPPPKSRKLVREGVPVGEFRSTGSQTIISGDHPEGARYRLIVSAPPVRVPFAHIVWPAWLGDASFTNSSQYSPFSPSSLESPSSPSLNTLYNIRERCDAVEAARKVMDADPALKRLYRRFVVEKRSLPRQGRRNSDLVELVTFLHAATGRKRALELASAFWELNQDIFTDSLEQHMHEAEAQLNAREATWQSALTPEERVLADQFHQPLREAFRICRDLAGLDTPESPRGKFFLSMGDLADRISLRAVEAQRIIHVLEGLGCLQVVTKGTKHSKEGPGIATRYRWVFHSMETPVSAP